MAGSTAVLHSSVPTDRVGKEVDTMLLTQGWWRERKAERREKEQREKRHPVAARARQSRHAMASLHAGVGTAKGAGVLSRHTGF